MLTRAYGIDTSVLVRFLTGMPREDFERSDAALHALRAAEPDCTFHVSNEVIGESYIVLQRLYGISKEAARKAILSLLSQPPLEPLNGAPVLAILEEEGGAGLVDRLIAQDYRASGITMLTNDRRMAKLPGAKLLG